MWNNSRQIEWLESHLYSIAFNEYAYRFNAERIIWTHGIFLELVIHFIGELYRGELKGLARIFDEFLSD